MHRLYCPSEIISGTAIIINDRAQLHHLKDVLRLRPGEKVTASDSKGNGYLCAAKELGRERIILEIIRRLPPEKKDFRLSIACAIPQNSRFDDIVDKLTQLGVEKIIPLITERTIVKLTAEKSRQRLARWKKIALAASQQSQRGSLPVVEPVTEFRRLIACSGGDDLKLIPALLGKRRALKQILFLRKAKDILALIGPEGDFTAQEAAFARRAGFIPVSLGDNVLRVETAAIAVASYIALSAK